MQEIESDITDYLDTNQIITQMNSAFGGSSTTSTSFTTTASMSSTTKNKKSSKAIASLEPILEEVTVGGQVVPYAPNEMISEQRAKKNEALKNKVRMLT